MVCRSVCNTVYRDYKKNFYCQCFATGTQQQHVADLGSSLFSICVFILEDLDNAETSLPSLKL